MEPLPDEVAAGKPGGRSAGLLYVLEGSVLGGRQLLGELQNNPDASVEGATGFLSGFGEQTPTRWRDFVIWLESLPVDEEFQVQAAEGAVWAFEQFSQVFQ